MTPFLPYVDLAFCLKCPILNITQRLLAGQYVVEGFLEHGLHGMWYVNCKIGWRQLHDIFSWAYPFTGRDRKESEHI